MVAWKVTILNVLSPEYDQKEFMIMPDISVVESQEFENADSPLNDFAMKFHFTYLSISLESEENNRFRWEKGNTQTQNIHWGIWDDVLPFFEIEFEISSWIIIE